MAKVLADGEVVSVVGAGTFNASSPLDRSVNTITSSDDFPSKRADVGSRLSKNTRALAKVQVLVSLDRGIPRLVKVVERDIGVLDDKVGVDVVVQVLADGEVDPVRLSDHRRAIEGAVLHNVQLILWSNATAEENL
jgi:hypothetical protein